MSEKAGEIGQRGGFWQRLSEKSELASRYLLCC
jgi:hypothetical protein